MAKDRPERPDSIQISRKFVDALSSIRDTMVRYDLARMRVRPETLQVELAGSCDECRDRYTIPEGRTTIGRGDGCDVRIEVGHVSRLHASFEVGGDEVVVRDEGSSNGTYVNGARVTEAHLNDGDLLHFGPLLRFVVVISRPGVPEVPSPPPRVDALAETELPDRPPPPTPTSTIEMLDRERRQLAILLQVAMRYLSTPAEEAIAVLFEVLDHVVQFDGAFVGVPQGDGLEFFSHPHGAQLGHDDYAKLAAECERLPVVRDSTIDRIVLGGVTIGSRVILPLEDGGCIGLHAAPPDLYSRQLDFLVIVSQIHTRAARR